MYRTEPLFPYADGKYSIMPAGLPERFYPDDESRVHETEKYVICFDKYVSEEIKQRLIKDYAEHVKEQKEKGNLFW